MGPKWTRLPSVRTSPSVRFAAVSSLLWVVGSGCSDAPPGNPLPDPPAVTVVLPNPTVVGTQIRVEITVTGCDQVQKVELFDDQLLLRTLTFSGNPLTFDVPANQIPYRNGIAANPLFKAKAICTDGRHNTSAPASGRFLPVDRVIRAVGGGQTVTDTFVATGAGSGTRFLGCSEDPAGGQRQVVAVNAEGSLINVNNSLAIACSDAATFSERTVFGTRWMLEPYDANNPTKPSGLLELNDELGPTHLAAVSTFASKALAMAVAPDGDVVVAILNPISDQLLELRRIRHGAGVVGPDYSQWPIQVIPAGLIISNIVIDRSAQVAVTSWREPIGNPNVGEVVVDRFDYRNGNRLAQYVMRQIAFGLGNSAPRPIARLNANGSVVYFPLQVTSVTSQVVACATRTPGCSNLPGSDGQPAGLLWESEVLPAPLLIAHPYASDSRLAAIGATAAWFLNAQTGAVVRSSQPLRPAGALVFLAFQEGRAKDFYLLSGSSRPTELIALENAEGGELIRFGLANGSLSVAVGDDGHPWFRVNNDLLKPHRLVEYRRAKIQ